MLKWIAVIVIPLLTALIVCLIMKGKMKTARKQTHADAYIPQNGVRPVSYTHLDVYKRQGASIMHGPHQLAQKSTTTGVCACITSLSKLSSVTIVILV